MVLEVLVFSPPARKCTLRANTNTNNPPPSLSLCAQAGTDTTSVEELCDLGFTTAAAEVAIAKAKRNPLGCMQDLILVCILGHTVYLCHYPAVLQRNRPNEAMSS